MRRRETEVQKNKHGLGKIKTTPNPDDFCFSPKNQCYEIKCFRHNSTQSVLTKRKKKKSVISQNANPNQTITTAFGEIFQKIAENSSTEFACSVLTFLKDINFFIYLFAEFISFHKAES